MQDAEYGRLEQRVYGIEQGLTAVVAQLERDRSDLASQMATDRAHSDQQFSSIHAALGEKGKIQWPALGVLVTFLGLIGAIVYWPIKEAQADAKDRFARLEDRMVPRTEHEREWMRNTKAMDSMLDLIQRNQQQIVPRGEHDEKWRTYTVAHADLQRQIDDARKLYGDTYTLKDALRSMQERLDRIELGRLSEAAADKFKRTP